MAKHYSEEHPYKAGVRVKGQISDYLCAGLTYIQIEINIAITPTTTPTTHPEHPRINRILDLICRAPKTTKNDTNARIVIAIAIFEESIMRLIRQ